MVKSMENGVSVAPFLLKCYEMVDDESTDELISWSQSNNSFIIWDESKFSSEFLPKYFKHSNMASFVRQLNIYGFRKIDTDRYEFANDGFLKGQKHLLKNIVRRKQSQNQVQRKSAQHKDVDPCTSEDDKRVALRKEVENLKTDKNALMQELIKLRQHQKTSQSKLSLLGEQLKGMEKNQQQMLSFIVMAMQNTGFLVQLLQPKENNWRMAETGKNILSPVKDNREQMLSDGAIVRYQPPTTETLDPCTTPTLSSEKSMEWDLSSDEVKDLLMSIDFSPVPWDEKLSFDNHGELILPDIPDNDSILDQLLLSSPSSENEEAAWQHSEACIDTDMEIESTFQPQAFDEFNVSDKKFGDYQSKETLGFDTLLENSESMDILTEQLELLNSKRSLRN